MSLDSLLDRTRQRFPHYHHTKVEISPLEKGGSDRRYYRVRFSTEYSLILVKYDRAKVENERFVSIANFLEGVGVNAPFIYYQDKEEGLIWMQDLGEEDLWHHRTEPWSTRRALYQSAIDQVIRLHRTDAQFSKNIGLLPGFDEGLYRWEQNYGIENCFGQYFGVPAARRERLAREPNWQTLAKYLAAQPTSLIHRDLQSQNIIIWDEQAYLIDFQGMRPGLRAYDFASLVFDPYVELTEPERSELLDYYHAAGELQSSRTEFHELSLLCAIQRLLQALGAYGVIGLQRGKPEFLRHIRPAIRLLRQVASSQSDFKFLADFVAELPDKPERMN
jgi:aminoglycoside/choline kinase family phosphotransferase